VLGGEKRILRHGQPKDRLQRRNIVPPLRRNPRQQPAAREDPGVELRHELIGRQRKIMVGEAADYEHRTTDDDRRHPGETKSIHSREAALNGERNIVPRDPRKRDAEQADNKQDGRVLNGHEILGDLRGIPIQDSPGQGTGER